MDFLKFKTTVATQFERMGSKPLFVTAIPKDDLWDTYLSSFPEGANPIFRERTEHDCNCCKQFIRAVGNLVTINDDLSLTSIWDFEIPGEPEYQVVANELAKAVKSYRVQDTFLHYERTAGTDKNFEQRISGTHTWNHLHVNIPMRFIASERDIPTLRGRTREGAEMLQRAVDTITTESIDTVLELIGQGSLYRGVEHQLSVSKFRELLVSRDPNNPNWAWANADNPFSRIRNTVIGTLLVDLSEGRSLDSAVKSFEDKVAPTNYKRPTALVTPKMVEAAKKKVEELGLTSALDRRFATIHDLTINNLLFVNRTRVEKDIFDGLNVKAEKPKLDRVEDVTIEQFLEHILPKATGIEALLENAHESNLFSLIAPVDPTARKMFKWNNGFSWTYNGNVADSIRERVKAAGGNVTGELCCRLAWEYTDDLDFHMEGPDAHIYFGNRKSYGGGMLDVDANGMNGMMDHPVENIAYPKISKMRDGTYELYVHNYSRRSEGVGFEVEIDILGQVRSISYPQAVPSRGKVRVATLRKEGNEIKIIQSLPHRLSSKGAWGMKTQQFCKVKAIMLSPNFWDNQHIGNKHYFFALEDCRNPDPARGFMNEFLTSELDEHRKVLEMVGQKLKTEQSEHQLSGLGFSSTQSNKLTCRVSGAFTRVINIIF